MNYRTREVLTKIIVILGLCSALFLGVAGCSIAANSIEYSSGTRTANLIKVSYKGLFWKTWEGELGIFEIGENGAAQPFDFTIPSESLANKLREAEGKKVKITYTQSLMPLPWKGGTRTYVTNFEIIE